jgi:hypothetical protein
MSAQTYRSPALIFTTTSNTTISPAVPPQASAWKVQLFQQIVQYDVNGGTNPDLRITSPHAPLNPAPYPTSVALRNGFDPWAHSPLTSPPPPAA